LVPLFTTALNTPPDAPPNSALSTEKLIALNLIAVCSPRLIEKLGKPRRPADLARFPLIHDDTLAGSPEVPTWADWFRAGHAPNADVSRGLRFNSSDHALDATGQGAGVLLAHDLLAYDDLRSGRLVKLFKIVLPSQRNYNFVTLKTKVARPHVQAFRSWLKAELATVDWGDMP